MKCSLPLLLLALACSPGISGGQVLVDSSNYSDLFGPSGSDVTVNPPDSLIGLTFGGSESGDLGTYWTADAEGGASFKLVVGVAETGAQVALQDGQLQFNISNNPGSLLGALGVGASVVDLEWAATATFDKSGSELVLAPNTTYRLVFDVDGSNGLLDSTLGIDPYFGVELLDENGVAVGAAGGGTLVNLVGLELLGIVGSPPRSGRAVVHFQTGAGVDDTGAASVRFTGSAVAPATVLGLGTKFATVTNFSLAIVPEPSVLGLAGLGAIGLFRRRRAA
jgi:hypothetical protein